MVRRKGFTLVELVVVILIVGILATVSVPILRGRIDSGKWVEAKTSAGAIKTAVRAYIATTDSAQSGYSDIEGSLGTTSVASSLGFSSDALNGAFFYQSDYVISDLDGSLGRCVITITSTHPKGPPGTGVLDASGNWSVSTGGGSTSGGDSDGGSISDGEAGESERGGDTGGSGSSGGNGSSGRGNGSSGRGRGGQGR